MNKNVLVNATSLSSGGALTILNQYINDLFVKSENDKSYYIFVPDTCIIKKSKENIKYIKNSENVLYKSRNYWNAIGMKKWCNDNKIKPYELYSMQNYYPFGFKKKSIYKSLYLHQSIPFYKYKWSIFKKEERNLWFYKNIYYILIKKSVKQSDKVIVQTEWFKNQIVNKIRFDEKKVVVERPVLNQIDTEKYNEISKIKGGLKLFYPVSGCVHKNHKILYKAMAIVVNEYNMKNVILFLTLDQTDVVARKYIDMFNLKDNVVLLGKINYEQVMIYYKSVDALVFPSKIETFGLPLVEAQQFKLPIIANDLELYHEVIGEYSGEVAYCNGDDERDWADNIRRLKK